MTCSHLDQIDPGVGASGDTGTSRPIIQSFEPGEDWLWCYLDATAFEVDELRHSASHP